MRIIIPGADFSNAGKGNVYRWYAYQLNKGFPDTYVTKLKVFYKGLIDNSLLTEFDVIRLWMGTSVAQIAPNFANSSYAGSNSGLIDANCSLTGYQKTGSDMGFTGGPSYTTLNGLHMHVYMPEMAATHANARAMPIGIGDTIADSTKNFAWIDKSRQGSRVAAFFGTGTANGTVTDVSVGLSGLEVGLTSAWRDSSRIVRLAHAGTIRATSSQKSDNNTSAYSIREGGAIGGMYSPDKIALTAYGMSAWNTTKEAAFNTLVTALMA